MLEPDAREWLVRIPDAPTYENPVVVKPDIVRDHFEGNFTEGWRGWFLALGRAVLDLQSEVPVSASMFSLTSGPGPITVQVTLTMRRPGTLNIMGSIVQTWATAAPSWDVDIAVDGSNVNTTGTISNTWQNVVTLLDQTTVSAGTHTVLLRWTAGNANATLASMVLNVFPAYTS